MKNRHYIFCIFTLALISSAGNISAEMYKWIDENGVTHFSDSKPIGVNSESVDLPTAPPDHDAKESQQKQKTLLESSDIFSEYGDKPRLASDEKQETWKAEFLRNLPQDGSEESIKMRKYFAEVPTKQLFPFGYGVCDSLNKGMSKTDILEGSYYQFWGVPASDAIYKAAMDVICPELKSFSN
jgi:hypothetical protein